MASDDELKHEQVKPASDPPDVTELPDGVDRGAFRMRSALIGATAVLTGRPLPRKRWSWSGRAGRRS